MAKGERECSSTREKKRRTEPNAVDDFDENVITVVSMEPLNPKQTNKREIIYMFEKKETVTLRRLKASLLDTKNIVSSAQAQNFIRSHMARATYYSLHTPPPALTISK